MVDIKPLLSELQKLVDELTDDLREQSVTHESIKNFLSEGFHGSQAAGRISQSYEEWRDDYLEQIAVNWVLACVFVRFKEDNGLLEECWIAGEGDRRILAEGAHELFFRQHPHETDREYLKHVFIEVRKIPAARELFDDKKNTLWKVDPSGDACRRLLNYFREVDAEKGGLKRKFVSDSGMIADAYCGLAPQAQFLGDLYQDLSKHARKKYALLQTPEFIQQFILDRTLTPAIQEFGLKNLRIIDPACGSGHFLLGAFDRLFSEWQKPENFAQCNENVVVAAQNALDSIFGVDINPFAVAITRFRLLLAAIQASGIKRLNQQSFAWKVNLAVGDSLLWGAKAGFDNDRISMLKQGKFQFEETPLEKLGYEEPAALTEILSQAFHVVVGNPPYITVKDKAQNEAYRKQYSTCHRQYSLGVPFTQRFWDLAIRKGEQINPNSNNSPTSPYAGYVGMITANSFMKREFGKKLIEEFFPKTDLTHVLDTSGAYIPGHGTPTVILFGRARKPVDATVRAVMGIKGEPSTPDDPSQGKVWRSILIRADEAGSQDEFTSSVDVPRTTFASHPWSIGGGGIVDLKERLEAERPNLSSIIESVGFMAISGEDDAFSASAKVLARYDLPVRVICAGETVRDWGISDSAVIAAPYDFESSTVQAIPPERFTESKRFFWPNRVVLRNRSMFEKTPEEHGFYWYEFMQFIRDRVTAKLSIVFGEVATHNHFVVNRGGRLFKQTAPMITFPNGISEEMCLGLAGLLNSSTGCFWLKQVCFPKGGDHVGQEGARVRRTAWDERYAFSSTPISRFPITSKLPVQIAIRLDKCGQERIALLPSRAYIDRVPNNDLHSAIINQFMRVVSLLIALQEELDWECYQLYGLFSEDLCYHGDDLPELNLGERAFEIVMARQMAKGEFETTWFERHGSTPITEIPLHWPEAYRNLVTRRIEVIDSNNEIALIEKPEYKRRWNSEPWEEQDQRALRDWLLDRLESPRYWLDPKTSGAVLQTTAQLADEASSDQEFMEVAALYKGRADFDLSVLIADLVDSEAVPFLPVLRYKAAGLRKREVWERTWELQRKEDAGENVGTIPVPPKYATADFLKTDYWRLRGKLDVPKERWISYPHCSTESDPSLLVGWAGWNHLEQATALVSYYDTRKRDGWDANRLTPLLAGLDQLLPWIHQWHPQIDPEFGETAGQSYQTMLAQDAHELGLTLEEIRRWTPPEKARKTATPRKAATPRKSITPRRKKAKAEADE